jgi:enoyl-CoA hydratase/carnithine racemase
MELTAISRGSRLTASMLDSRRRGEAMASADEVLFTVDDRVATITINRPDKRNALNGAVLSGLHRFLDQLSGDSDIGAVVLRGAGGTFCAGADLGSGMATEPKSFLDEHEGRGEFARLLQHMTVCKKPILAAIEGYCLAGGMGLCLASDMVIAAEDAQFGTPEIKRGLWPYMVTALLIRNVGRKKALELCMVGDRISAVEAQRIGLINYAVPAGDFEDKVREMASKLSSYSPAIMGLGKAAFYRIADMTTDDALHYLQSQLTINAQTEDVVEGIAAFFEKRKPRWKGK